ncbi:MAG: ATP-binding cassette domain-containing protein [Firmicutes bacterium]|nr:ATP-binding cassette domain-containing protein [Bacillota bacterium]
MIKLDNVSYKYRRQKEYILRDFSLEINDGEFIILKGSNGSGKSTLARLIAGITKPRKGTVTIDGINTRDKKRFYDLRSTISIIFQNPETSLLFDRVYDDIAFGLENLKIPKTKHPEIIAHALELVGMTGFENHSTYELSMGQKQRIAIAGILAMNCKIIVADEITAMLDTGGKQDIYNLLWELNSRGITIILATNIDYETKRGRIINLGGES